MKPNEIKQAIDNMTSAELVELNNRYCQEVGYSNDEIFSNDEEFFEMFFANKPMDAVRASFYGDYRYADDFVRFDGYGNLYSFNSMTTNELVDIVDTMAEEIADRFEDFEDLFN